MALPVGFAVTLGGLTFSPGLGWGLVGVYVAVLGDMYARAAVNLVRYDSDAWKQVALQSKVGTSTDAD